MAEDRDDELKRDAVAEMDRLLDKSRLERARHLGALAQSRPELHALVVDLMPAARKKRHRALRLN